MQGRWVQASCVECRCPTVGWRDIEHSTAAKQGRLHPWVRVWNMHTRLLHSPTMPSSYSSECVDQACWRVRRRSRSVVVGSVDV